MNVKELREKVARLEAEHDEVMQLADQDGWTDELRSRSDQIHADQGDALETIQRIAAQAEMRTQIQESRTERRETLPATLDNGTRKAVERDIEEGGSVRRFLKWMRTNDLSAFTQEERAAYAAECRQQLTTPDAVGGYLIPEEVVTRIETALLAYGGVRGTRATVIRTRGGNPLHFPTSDDTANASAILAENTAHSVTDFAFSEVIFGAYKFATMVQASYELLSDNVIVDFEGWLAAQIGVRNARGQAAYLTTGTGTAQPEGFVTGATNGPTAGGAAIDYDDVVNLVQAVVAAYAVNGEFGCNWATIVDLRNIKDSQGMPMPVRPSPCPSGI
jgi:HK97 family phage major capsid protein